MILQVDNYTKEYKGKAVLSGASMHIGEGEMVALLGPSGSGKTSFAKDVAKKDFAQIVFQQPTLALDPNQKIGKGFEELKAYFGLESDVLNLIESVGLSSEILNHRPYQISGGEAQRVNIARALMFNPKLLILDEATSMLDVQTQDEIISLVKKLVIEKGGAVLFISHDLEYAKNISDRVYCIEDGRFNEH